MLSVSMNAWRFGTAFGGNWRVNSPVTTLPDVPWATRCVPLIDKSPVAVHIQLGWIMSMMLMLQAAVPDAGAVPTIDHASVESGSER